MSQQFILDVPSWALFNRALRDFIRSGNSVNVDYAKNGLASIHGDYLDAHSYETKFLVTALYRHEIPFQITDVRSKHLYAWRPGLADVVPLGHGMDNRGVAERMRAMDVRFPSEYRCIPAALLAEQFPFVKGRACFDRPWPIVQSSIVLTRFENGQVANIPWSACDDEAPGYDWGVDNRGARCLALNILNALYPPEKDGRPSVPCAHGRVSATAHALHRRFAAECLAAVPKPGASLPAPAILDWAVQALPNQPLSAKPATVPSPGGLRMRV